MNGLTTRALSIGLGGIAAVSLLMTGGQAQAQTPAPCPTDASASILTPTFSCMLGDKTFSGFTVTNADSGALVHFGQLGPLFAVTLGRGAGFFPIGSTLDFDYTVTAAAPQHIVQGTLGVDVSFPTVVTITSMNGLSLTPSSILNGGTAMIVFGPGVDTVVVDNTSHVFGQLNSISNDFTQVMVGVPEPASLSLFGLGLLGLGFTRRRQS